MPKEIELPGNSLSVQIRELQTSVDSLMNSDAALHIQFTPGQEPFPDVTVIFLTNERYSTYLNLEEKSHSDKSDASEKYLTFRITDKSNKSVETIRILHGITPFLENSSFFTVDYKIETDVPPGIIDTLTTSGRSFRLESNGSMTYFDEVQMVPRLQKLLDTSEIDVDLQYKAKEFIITLPTFSSVY